MPANPKALTEEFLRLLGFNAAVEVHEVDDGLLLEIQCEDAGRLVGRQGQTLSELQYVVNRMIFQLDRDHPKVTLDAGSYRSQHREELLKSVTQAIEKVRRWGDPVELPPLNAYDRRFVYHTLRDDATVEAVSVEIDGTTKKVILLRPKRPAA